MAIDAKKIEDLLKIKFPDAIINLTDLVGDNDHYHLEIISSLFENKNLVQQHRMVNEALSSCLGTSLHALKITTKTK